MIEHTRTLLEEVKDSAFWTSSWPTRCTSAPKIVNLVHCVRMRGLSIKTVSATVRENPEENPLNSVTFSM